jgi:ferrochelatase
MGNPDCQKTAAILLAMGGPDSLDDIPEYLHNIFSDRDLIRLPGGRLGQKLLARIISRARTAKVREHYRLIGGSSPLLKWTEAQAHHIENKLADSIPGFKCYVGMRYFRPTIAAAISQAANDGYNHLILVPMYPQFSKATTGSCLDEARRALKKHQHLNWSSIDEFHADYNYITLMRHYIAMHSDPNDFLLFSAHSLPQKLVDDGDPYVDQVKRTAELAADGREYAVSFQSRTGPVKWVGPETIVEAERLLNLYEVDIELPDELGAVSNGRLKRMPMFNDDPKFADCLAGLIRSRIPQNAPI